MSDSPFELKTSAHALVPTSRGYSFEVLWTTDVAYELLVPRADENGSRRSAERHPDSNIGLGKRQYALNAGEEGNIKE